MHHQESHANRRREADYLHFAIHLRNLKSDDLLKHYRSCELCQAIAQSLANPLEDEPIMESDGDFFLRKLSTSDGDKKDNFPLAQNTESVIWSEKSENIK